MFYFYLLISEKEPKQVYVGLTTDLRARFSDHNAGGSPYTSKDRRKRGSVWHPDWHERLDLLSGLAGPVVVPSVSPPKRHGNIVGYCRYISQSFAKGTARNLGSPSVMVWAPAAQGQGWDHVVSESGNLASQARRFLLVAYTSLPVDTRMLFIIAPSRHEYP